MCLHCLSASSQTRGPSEGRSPEEEEEEEEGRHLVGVRAHLGDLRISDPDILFVQSTPTGPLDSSTFSYGSYL